MENSLISVIIPVYKVEKYLDKCVQSVVDQTYKNLEIILVDDGSPDGCPEICDKWAKKDSRIKVIHKKNEGASSARNVGLDIATGEYIGFVDSDDYIDTTMYEKLLNKAKEEDADMTMCRFFYTYEDGKNIKLDEVNIEKCNEKKFIDYMFVNPVEVNKIDKIEVNYVMCVMWRNLYRKKILENIKFDETVLLEDPIYQCEVLKKHPKIALVNDYLYYYLQREGSLIRQWVYEKNLNHVSRICALGEGFLSKEVLNCFKFRWYCNFFRYFSLNFKKKEIKSCSRFDEVQRLNTKETYADTQKIEKSKIKKIKNYLVHKEMYKLFRFIFKLLKR